MKPLKATLLALLSSAAWADTVVQMHAVTDQGAGENLGQVTISATQHGLVFTPALQGLAPGLHGFHLHQHPSCEPREKDGKMTPALAAGAITIRRKAIATTRPGATATSATCRRSSSMPTARPRSPCWRHA